MFVIFIFLLIFPDYIHGEVVWAVNCGGPKHIDSHGVKYKADFLNIGTASDYGRSFAINRVVPEDYILYQTERYHNDDFSYPIPVISDGEYILTLKFSEVWFTEIYQKVFDVYVQHTIPIVQNLDIFGQVGFATAYDFHLQFKIKDRVLFIGDSAAPIDADHFTVDFIKTQFDNPKINAIVVTKGTIEGRFLVFALPYKYLDLILK
ncbi:Malectin-B isoform 1 [Schistosoma japonicum]|uniref:Malectin-B isoform 1 n=1 Tax=Schistosoma japonicum TaxID=6182 RepID=A0A4Z2D440_SCHJA|nr:Malectin-B isoform 1 [Schistosoma japonicum]